MLNSSDIGHHVTRCRVRNSQFYLIPMDYTEKMEKNQPTAVAIDGTRIRSIRETKKLTQLYVASVVGVTTDTISRWENNRYPSIKWDNAEKLAGALEVALDEILKVDDELVEATATLSPEIPIPLPTADRGRRLRGLLVRIIIVVVAVLGILLRLQQVRQMPTAQRHLPAYAAPGAIIPVKIVLHRQPDDRRGLIVKEQLPEGWTLVAASPTVMAPGPKQELKWLIPGGGAEKQLLYTVQVAAGAVRHQDVQFTGIVKLEEKGNHDAVPIQGTQQIRVAGLHWADQNGDQHIDDTEIMPAYYLTEEFKGFSLNWQEIETIWNSSGYLWDEKAHAARPQP